MKSNIINEKSVGFEPHRSAKVLQSVLARHARSLFLLHPPVSLWRNFLFNSTDLSSLPVKKQERLPTDYFPLSPSLLIASKGRSHEFEGAYWKASGRLKTIEVDDGLTLTSSHRKTVGRMKYIDPKLPT